MMEKDEKILLRFPSSVKYKKQDGTLTLRTNYFVWNSHADGGPRFNCTYSDIKVQRISPDSSSKVQLQIVLHDESSSNFHFANIAGREAQVRERNEVKELLAQLIPQHRDKMNKDLEQKNKILNESPEVYQLYRDLVVGGIISADEFWERRKATEEKTEKKQEVGIASGFLAELKPDTHGVNELRFNLTVDNIEAIFKMYPAVKKRYMETVPDEMTEKEFWTEFFQSQHFHRDRLQKTNAKDVLGDCAKKDEQEQFKQMLANFFDPVLDLTPYQPTLEEGYGRCRSASDKKSSNDSLIKQFNHQSLMVLQNSLKRSNNSLAAVESKSEKVRIQELVNLPELGEERETEVAELKIIDTDKFSHSSATNIGHTNGSSTLHNGNQSNLGTDNWTMSLTSVITAEAAGTAMADLSPGGRLLPHTSQQAESASEKDLEELRKAYVSLSELLRHFWSCFPVKTPQLEEKVTRMATCLEKFRDSRLMNLKSTISSAESCTHMSRMLEAALAKLRAWKERRTNAPRPANMGQAKS